MTIILDSPVHVVSGPAHPDSGSGQDDRSPDRGPLLDEEKTATWLRKLSVVLPQFATHHRGGNISRITEARYLDALRAYATVVDDLCTGAKILRPDDPAPKITSSDYNWFERICFSLIAFLLQCDATTIVSIFIDNCEETILSQRSISSVFEGMGTEQPGTVPETLTPERITERYLSVFFFQTILLAALHLDGAKLDVPPPLLPAPALPHFHPPSSSLYYSHPYHGNGTHAEPGAITTALSAPLRPWLHDALVGTPLAALSSTTSCAWVGYYTYKGVQDRDLPMYIELRSTPPPDAGAETDTEAAHDRVYFRGVGHDGVGMFDLNRTCDTRTGVISAIKAYGIMLQWEWRGMLTPFGMTGMWGPGWDNAWGAGWWWIWPREWSPATSQHHE